MKTSPAQAFNKWLPRKWSSILFAACLGWLFIMPITTFAEDDPVLPFDEILVFMNVQGVGNIQVPAAIRNETAYLSVTDVFDFLKIRNTPSNNLDSITGYLKAYS